MLARDQSSPERTATATVIVNIRRSNFPPVFVNTPYFTGVNVGSAIGSTIYTVTATDGDLLVSVTLCIFWKIKLWNTCMSLIVIHTCMYLCLQSFILFLLTWIKYTLFFFPGFHCLWSWWIFVCSCLLWCGKINRKSYHSQWFQSRCYHKLYCKFFQIVELRKCLIWYMCYISWCVFTIR